ncbi:MAG: hypothetical protein MZW92_28420 [Comamonadaceae bacterium]|nr:hypothetical protein [Comamonadaceae bacterium]
MRASAPGPPPRVDAARQRRRRPRRHCAPCRPSPVSADAAAPRDPHADLVRPPDRIPRNLGRRRPLAAGLARRPAARAGRRPQLGGRRAGAGAAGRAAPPRARHSPDAGPLSCRVVRGDVRALHRDPAHAGALFQVASQFNLLEMVGPDVTPDDGVGRYEFDRTQGPACAVACGAATIVRNYFVPVDGRPGQSATRQIDALAALGDALAAATGRPREALWAMRNGYALPTRDGLQAVAAHLSTLDEPGVDALRAALAIGVHRDVEVTDVDAAPGPRVAQAFCSALPVSYARLHGAPWAAFATLVLEAAYEATLLEARIAAASGRPPRVFLTRLGGGAFGNDERWIDAAMRRALRLHARSGLDVRIVGYAPPSAGLLALAAEAGG